MARFNSCKEMAEAIIARDVESVGKGEIFWAISLGIAIAGTGGKPQREVLIAVAEIVDQVDAVHGAEGIEASLGVLDRAIDRLS